MKHTFDVTVNGTKFQGLNMSVGASASDEAWLETVSSLSDVNDLAIQQATVKVQAYVRSKDPKNADEAQAYADQYRYKATSSKQVVDASKVPGITLEQCNALEASGLLVINKPKK